jgi:hypothetical protein
MFEINFRKSRRVAEKKKAKRVARKRKLRRRPKKKNRPSLRMNFSLLYPLMWLRDWSLGLKIRYQELRIQLNRLKKLFCMF